jgi:hypothetical protein
MTLPDPRTPNPSDQPSFHWPPMPASPPLPQPSPAPKKKRRPLLVLAAAIGLFILIATIIGITLGATSGTPRTSTPTGSSAEDQQRQLDETPAAEPTTEPPARPVLTAADVTLKVKITQQKCYGYGAGCSVTYRVTAGWPDGIVSDGDTYLVTYEVWPVENGPQVNSLTITDNTHYEANGDEDADTKARVKSLKVKVTGVEKVGI